MARRPLFAFAVPALLLMAACTEPEAPAPRTAAKPAGSAAASAAAAAQGASVAPGHLARADVERVLRQGPPWLLRRVVPEEVIRGGKFIGWRILSMPDDWSVDLKSGDVVTRVNGLALERPDDLWAVWVQLQSAPQLKISYERDGQPRDLVLPIDGPSAGAADLKGDAQAPEPPPSKPPSRWQTTVIEGGETAPPSDEPQGE